ncbi:DUF4333 domain-containing protein [Mycobacteroides abscessus subsp. bolletii]|uniref:DUF4333 domain-containing protein n=1 Tax=Mycobacteroides abscessus TaxID=36809 RepID=UPI00266C4D35|nr:DUF4333 domain-containing protein [Mycobacteroides abscessus]MDO3129663.1 DUF4333 domain-containing protein [Mycobacteroides abscessus subsp. bolletii]
MAADTARTARASLMTALMVVGVIGATALSGCGSDAKSGSSSNSLSRATLESDLEQLQGWENNPFGGEVRKAVCQGGIELRNGATQTCTITVSGHTHTLTVVIKDASTNPPIFGIKA